MSSKDESVKSAFTGLVAERKQMLKDGAPEMAPSILGNAILNLLQTGQTITPESLKENVQNSKEREDWRNATFAIIDSPETCPRETLDAFRVLRENNLEKSMVDLWKSGCEWFLGQVAATLLQQGASITRESIRDEMLREAGGDESLIVHPLALLDKRVKGAR